MRDAQQGVRGRCWQRAGNVGHRSTPRAGQAIARRRRDQVHRGRGNMPFSSLKMGPTQSWGSGGLHDVRAWPLAFRPNFHQPQNPSHAPTLGQRTSAEIPDRRRTPNLATVPRVPEIS